MTEATQHRLAAIMAADVVSYSRLIAADEAGTLAAMRAHRSELWGPSIEENGGRLVGTAGDSLLAEFPSAVAAVNCAVANQRAMPNRHFDRAESARIRLRIGINLGDVAIDGDDIHGDGVNIAARLEAEAQPDGICISDDVARQIQGRLDLDLTDGGLRDLKNIARPVQVWHWTQGEATSPQAAISQAPKDRPSIAVLPFDNMSGDPEQAYFADGITEEIITALSRFRELTVIARNSTFQFKDQSLDVREIGQRLNVRFVLEGSVRRAAQKIRVTAQLLDARDGSHLWAERYDGDSNITDIFEFQDDLASQVVAAIADSFGVLSNFELEKRQRAGTDSADAFEAVLRARAFYNGMGDHASVRDALENAVKTDPNYADAWGWLAATYREEHTADLNPRPNSLERAEKAALTAIKLDRLNQQGHLALAQVYFYQGKYEQARVQTDRAIDLNPNSADLLGSLAFSTAAAGDWDKGVALANKALHLSPNPPGWMYWPLLWNSYRIGEYDQALEYAFKANKTDFYLLIVHFAMIYGQMGETEKARVEVERLLAAKPEFPEKASSLLAFMGSGDFLDQVFEGLEKAGLVVAA